MNKLYLCKIVVGEQITPIALICAKTKDQASDIITAEIQSKSENFDMATLNINNLGFALDHVRIGFVINNIL